MIRPPRNIFRKEEVSRFAAIAFLGASAFLIGLRLDPARAWGNLLLVNFCLISLSLAAAAFIAMHYLAGAAWPTVIRRVPEAMTSYLPAGAVGMAVLLLGIKSLYHWAIPGIVRHDEVLRAKSVFLNVPFFAVRAVLYFVIWIWMIRTLVSNSLNQDISDSGEAASWSSRNKRLSGGFLVVLALTFSIACVDWIMSLEPHWYSTIYPWYVFTGSLAGATAAIAALAVFAKRRGAITEVRAVHLHDLGKYMFAFSVLWAYLWFCQGLLIWYSNIPDETSWYVARLAGGWRFLFWLNPTVNFAAPFLMLLEVRRKKDERWILATALIMLFGRWLDAYLLVMPPILEAGPTLGWLELGTAAGAAAVFLILFERAFSSAAPIPIHDPTLPVSVHYQ